jgi:hypothetical protein
MTSHRLQIHGGGLASHGSQGDGGVCSKRAAHGEMDACPIDACCSRGPIPIVLIMDRSVPTMRGLQLSAADLES